MARTWAFSVLLTDSAFLNIFASTFTPGSLLSFDFGWTTTIDAGGTPDEFSLVLLQSDGTVVSTQDPTGANSLLTVDLDSARPTFNSFASDFTPAAIVTQSTALPEPPTMLLLSVCLATAAWSVRKTQAPIPFNRRTSRDRSTMIFDRRRCRS